MSAPPPPRPSGGSMSLYANLLDSVDDSNSSTAIASKHQSESKDNNALPAKKAIDPALRFQPMLRRPQVNRPTAKPKLSFPKAPPPTGPSISSAPAAAQPPQRSTLADWAATEEDEYLYGASNEKRQRGGRKKKKKKADERQETDWDEIYDPARPTNVEEYLRSDERIREVREWKDVLYAHRRKSRSRDRYSDEEEDEPDRRGMGMNSQFAPPSSFNFAPPPMSPSRAAVNAPDDATGDDAYARRMALSQQQPPPPPPESNPLPAPPPPPPNPTDAATISRAPVRYSPPPPSPTNDPDAMDVDSNPSDSEPVDYSSIDVGGGRLPQKTRGKAFASKLMSKYGWTAGTGLGASSSGITTALSVQPLKRKKKSDAEGGGFRDPAAAQGRIIAPKSLNTAAQQQQNQPQGNSSSTSQKISRVVVLRDMLLNMPDLASEIEAGLGQEIGEECGERYGRVERLFIDQDERLGENKRVYIQFVEEVSALRAVNALEGRIFNGNTIRAGFYDAEKFEEGVYEA
ncbi:hypothetical protein QBC40DRAFT_278246 [Triangularia verruculosa]|uniref:G-patch domain-containing protein n=1 Tax=Triangularia verruculosa TaxID=2587418 RepID=A0AAN6XIK3_9PEZI|nr:hypothetical protein QBC40DRAFT_278246 [Triangularia verruculosa]